MAKGERAHARHETVMDITAERIARVYAQAFLSVAAKHAATGQLVEEIGSLVDDVLDKFPRLDETLRTALVSQEHKEQILDRVFGSRAAVEVLNFLKVLSRHNRLELLRPVSRWIAKFYAEQQNRTDVEIRVATELEEHLLRDIQQQLEKTLGKEPRLTVIVDPSLVAGMVVRVGDRVYDGSVGTQLRNYRKAMIARAAEMIETQPEKFFNTAG